MSQRNDFFQAILNGDESTARTLFADGRLDANIRDGLIGGTPALSLAVHSGMIDLARDLLSQGADPNRYDSVDAPIHHARSKEMIELLVKAGADVNAQTLKQIDDLTFIRAGTTPLHLAVLANRADVVTTLLELKANPQVVDAAYRTAEQYADGKPDILRLLQNARGIDADMPSTTEPRPVQETANPRSQDAGPVAVNEIGLPEGIAQVNAYRMDGADWTTGWNPDQNEVNGVNADGMRPIEVAAQALNVREFLAIATHAEFDPTGVEPRKYAEIGRNADAPYVEERYETMREALDMYERAVSHLIRLDPATPTVVQPESQLDNGLPTVAGADNPSIAQVGESRVAANDPDVVKAANDPDKSQAEPQMNPDLERVRLARDADRKFFEASQDKGDAARGDDRAAQDHSRAAEVSFVRRVLRGAMQEARERVETRFAPTLSRLDALSRNGTDKGQENEVKPAPILSKSGYEIPKSVVAQYVAFDGKFLDRKTEVVLFEDAGRKLSTSSDDRNVIRSMVEVAQAKNWGELQLKGSEEFRRQAWIAAELAGLKSKGFNPAEKDHALLQVAREEMRISGASKDQDRAPTQDTAAARNTMQPEMARERDRAPAVEPAAPESKAAPAGDREAAPARTNESQSAEKAAVDASSRPATKPGEGAAPGDSAQSDAAELSAAREQFNARAQAIKDRAKPGHDVLPEQTARMVLQSRIKSLPKAAQERFMADFEAEVSKMKELGQELYVPVPKASRVLLDAAKLADQQRHTTHDQQQGQEQAQELDR